MPKIDSIVEEAIREKLEKPMGELTKVDLENVVKLDLGDGMITDSGLKDVAKCRQLNIFILDGFQEITDLGLKEVAKLKQLTVLWLGGNEITDSGLKEVTKLKQLSSLTLHSQQITDSGLKELAKLKQLKYLYLSDTKVTKAGVAQLQKALPKCYISTNLWPVETTIREEIRKPSGELTKADFEKVVKLDIGFKQITDEDLKEVAKCKQIELLYLLNNVFTDAGLKEVAELQQLKLLDLSFTKILTWASRR